MRVIAGELRGRRLAAFRTSGIRPTPDRVREAVFNILSSYGPFERVLDLFAGTGAMGIEALSRGAAEAVFVEASPASLAVIRRNIDICSLEARSTVVASDVGRAITRFERTGAVFDLVFLDPPYDAAGAIEDTLGSLGGSKILAPAAIVVAEGPAGQRAGGGGVMSPEAARFGRLERIDERRYGDTAIGIYEYGSAAGSGGGDD